MLRHPTRNRAVQNIGSQTIGFLLGGLWMAGGRMLLGMGLMKLGVFAATRSRRFYWTMLGLGYGIGMPLVVYDTWALIQHDFGNDYVFFGYGMLINYVASVIVALTFDVDGVVQGGRTPSNPVRRAAGGLPTET